ARNFLRWGVFAGVCIHELFRSQVAAGGTVRTVHNHSLIAEENRSGAGNLVIGGETLRARDGLVAVVPDDGNGTSSFSGRELEGDFCCGRISEAVLDYIIIGHFRANGFRRIEAQGPERGIDDMAEPVADGAGS